MLTVENLRMYFPVKSTGLVRRTIGHVQAVDGISFEVPKGGSLGLVGESGCGKSTTGRLITRLYKPTGGSMTFDGVDLAKLSNRELRPVRRDVQMIFQDPYTSLNPRQTVGAIVGAPLAVHDIVPRNQVKKRVQELLEVVGLNPEHYNRYPNEFSGGQRQRIGIARALTLNPSCSSPTSRCRRSTCRSRRRSSTCSRTSRRSSASRSSSSRTTSRSSGTSARRSR
ncbi:dipeptide/oligopeptide/nickel ABC transporter ATP-binding protein [Nocardioides sp. TF02-7]|uniref:ATP-binding cassette domain-containing protein n=1 Tax=Nocardioides sp. TF02-7 TaxID=2917724 RepID=UPI0023DB45C0|nr:dipeptide/oligopeptide/nickel ABC transporter ATP-binding protein [Nocardioides sp. TF02-7]